MKKALILAALTLLATSCSPRNPAFITLVSSDVEELKISIDGRTFTLRPANHITKEIEAGMHQIKMGDQIPTLMNAQKGLTSVFDSSGLSCFVVMDYSNRRIVERFNHQKVFSTSVPMTAMLGAELPSKPKPGDIIMRLEQVDCDIIGDDQALLKELVP